MGVLSTDEIKARLALTGRERLVVAPILEPEEQLRAGQASIDVRLGCRFRLVEATSEDVIDTINRPRRPPTRPPVFIPLGRWMVLHPHQLLLAETLEFVRLPPDLMSYVAGRSTWARDGLLVATAVGIHPGFAGCVTLELRNLGEVPICLFPGDLIAQLFIEQVIGPSTSGPLVNSQFSGGGGPRRGDHRYKVTDEKLRKLCGHRS